MFMQKGERESCMVKGVIEPESDFFHVERGLSEPKNAIYRAFLT